MRVLEKTKPIISLGLILLAGVAVRLLYWPELTTSATFASPTTDASYHQHWARGLAFGNWQLPGDVLFDPDIPHQPYFRPPGYPYFLALVYRIAGPDPRGPCVANMVLGLGTAILLFFFVRRLWGGGPALLAGLLCATYWAFIYYEGMLLEPPLLAFLAAGALLACSRWVFRITWWNSILAGWFMGLGILVRPNLLACVPVCLGWGLWLNWQRRGGGKNAGILTAAFLGVIVLTLTPAFIRNYRVCGEWPVLTTNGGINLYVSNNSATSGMYSTLPPDFKEVAGLTGTEWTSFDYPHLVESLSKAIGRPLTAVESDHYFRQLGWGHIRRHPGQTAIKFLKNLLLFWGPKELGNNLLPELDRQQSRILRRGLSFPAILTLALVGGFFLIRSWRQPPPAAASVPRPDFHVAILLILFMAAYTASFLPFFIAGRYRLAMAPLLMVFAGKGLWDFAGLIRRRDYGFAAGLLAFALAGFILLSKPIVPSDAGNYLWHCQQGIALQKNRRYPEAEAQFRQAIAANPQSAMLYINLGACQGEAGNLPAARQSFEKAVQLGPRLAPAHANLALACLELRQPALAQKHFRKALELNPQNATWWSQLGIAEGVLGNNAEAGACFRKALELDPAHREARIYLQSWEEFQKKQPRAPNP